mmetsp:Transcript_34280/g.51169  ORF Transcript_34280/g.51169 Transcript_34280/m.51169 type:complete len:496 (-) Transcript_34280:1510-2997(-)
MSSSSSATSSATSGSNKEPSNKVHFEENKEKNGEVESKDNKEEGEERKMEEQSNDFIITDGFPALNNFRKEKDPPIPRNSFASYSNALCLSSNKRCRSSLLEDCEKVFTARTKDGDAAYSAGCTFFVPCHMKPRCALEKLALDVFRTHTKGLEGLYDEERSGAEWWTLVLESSPTSSDEKKNDNSDGEEDEYDDDDDEVGLHFDADYGLEAQLPNYMIHPRVATVTYLSDVGVPTFVLDKKSPSPKDVTKSSLNGDITSGWLSHPLAGKHIAFDGRLLHGAPGTFFPASKDENVNADGDEEEGENDESVPATKRQKISEDDEKNVTEEKDDDLSKKRVTFLVNIWLNHCPIDAELLDEEICETMTTPMQMNNDVEKGKRKKGDDDGMVFEWKLQDASKPDHFETLKLEKAVVTTDTEPAGSEETVLCNREVTVYFNSSMEECHKASLLASLNNSSLNGEEKGGIGGVGKSAQVEFGKNAFTIVVGDEVKDSDDEE